MSAKQNRKPWIIGGALGCVGAAWLCILGVWFLFWGGNQIFSRVARPPAPAPQPRVAISAQNAEKLEVLYQFTVTPHACRMAWSPDSRWLAVDTFADPFTLGDLPPRDVSLHLWNIEKGEGHALYSDLELHFGHSTSVGFAPDGQILVYRVDTLIRFWDLPDNRELAEQTFANETAAKSAFLAVVPDWVDGAICPAQLWATSSKNNVVVTVADDNGLTRFNLGRSKLLVSDTQSGKRYEFGGPSSHGNAVEFSPDGQFLAIGYSDGTVQLWGIRP